MKRKKSSGGGGANWMDTYGDMVTLLLCFFVLLYAMSDTSEEKWRALVASFNPDAIRAETLTPGGDGPNADADEGGMPITDIEKEQMTIDENMEDLFQALVEYVAQVGEQSRITVTKEGGKVYISFNDSVFFAGDSPTLLEEAYPVLNRICEMLNPVADSIDEIRVLGHTAQGNANRPNNVRVDRTLSSQRATNVVIHIQTNSTVDPARLVSEGVGQWRPIATNQTSEGRAQNRRVEMIISGRNLEEELNSGLEQYTTEYTTQYNTNS